jgi:hypothetical protein
MRVNILVLVILMLLLTAQRALMHDYLTALVTFATAVMLAVARVIRQRRIKRYYDAQKTREFD